MDVKLAKKHINLYRDISGNSVKVPVYILGVGKNSAYIQGGIHGGEATYWIFHELLRELKDIKVKGKIYLVPISNPVSWQQKSYYYTAGKFSFTDGKDFNRNFPGKSNGTLSERVSAILFSQAIKSDLIIDLHTANTSKPYVIVTKQDLLEWGKATDLKYVLVHNFKDNENAPLTTSVTRKGKIGIAIECGSHDQYNHNNIRMCVEALLRILAKAGIVDYKGGVGTKIQYGSDTLKKYLAPKTGFVKYVTSLGHKYKKGDLLYKLYCSQDLDKVLNIRAEENGILLLKSRTHIVNEGDYVIEVIPKHTLKVLK